MTRGAPPASVQLDCFMVISAENIEPCLSIFVSSKITITYILHMLSRIYCRSFVFVSPFVWRASWCIKRDDSGNVKAYQEA
ncbi:hypothetical protein DsansV1_C05g0055661 [Dioscorea sansibarensis]